MLFETGKQNILFKNLNMKHFINVLAVCLLCFCNSASAQKPIDEEKVKKAVLLMQKMMTDPGQMQNVMTEMQALKLNSAENKEAQNRMQSAALKQAGEIKKQVTTTGGITEKQITEFKDNKERIVPLRDDVRINAVLKRDLSDAEMKNYCRAVHEAVKKEMNPAAVSQAEIIYEKLKAKYPSTASMGNGAISCYLANLTQQSIYIMGKVCSADASDANNLNNYSALLTNHGVEQGAIPILNYLNKRFAKSPVVMSNISLAWMGLGDLKTAEKFADSCIRFFPGNAAQAHYVKAVVKESEGNRQGAIEELKQSIGESYSAEKVALLKKMGGKLSAADHKKKLPADALGLSRFNFPSLPRSYEAAVNSTLEWETFYKNLESNIKELEIKTERLKKEYDAKATADAKAAIDFAKQKKGSSYAFAANNNTNQSWNNFYQLLEEEFVKKEEAFMKEARQLTEKNSKMLDELDTIVKVVLAKRFEQDALDKKFTDAEACNAYKEAYDNYMQPANTMFEKYYSSYIDHKRKMTNELVYAGKQFMDKAYYEYYASNSKLQFLYTLQSVSYEIPSYSPGNLGGYAAACINVKTNSFTNNGLANWNDLNCGNKWEMKIPFCGVATDCDKITFKFDVLFAEGSYSENLFTGEWTNMTLEVGAGIGSKKVTDKLGVEIGGAEVEVGGFIEIDRSGISDYGVKGKAAITGGEAVPVVGSISLIEAEGKLSLKSGKPSFEVKSDMSKASVSVSYK